MISSSSLVESNVKVINELPPGGVISARLGIEHHLADTSESSIIHRLERRQQSREVDATCRVGCVTMPFSSFGNGGKVCAF